MHSLTKDESMDDLRTPEIVYCAFRLLKHKTEAIDKSSILSLFIDWQYPGFGVEGVFFFCQVNIGIYQGAADSTI